MTDLVAAMNVSDYPNTGNHKSLGIVVGTRDKINSIIRDARHIRPHTSRIKSKSVQQRVITGMRFDGNKSAAFCMRIDKNDTIRQLVQAHGAKNKTASKKKLHVIFNRSAMYHIRQEIEGFLLRHNNSIQDVVFECDGDCVDLVKDNGLRHRTAGDVHMLADALAWANNHRMEPEGAVTADLTKVIRKACYKRV